MRYEYPAIFESVDDEVIISFPDVPEVVTSGASHDEAYREAADALGAALAGYAVQGRVVPRPSRIRQGMQAVSPPPLVVAKLALRARMQALGVSNVALAERLGVTEAVVRRLVDPDHENKLSRVTQALAALGQQLVVDVKDTPYAGARI